MTKKKETAEQEFIKNVLKEIRFPLVKQDIRQELQDHIEDKKEDWMFMEDMTEEEALEKSIEEMGQPEEIGKSLNAVHHPLLGWALTLSKWLLILLVALSAYYLYTDFHRSNFYGSPPGLESGKVIGEVPIDKEITLDHRTLYIDRAIFQEPDEVIVLMESRIYTRRPRSHHLFFRSASNVDEEVNYHYLASPYRVRFFRGDLALALYGVDFEADSVTLRYDQSNREFEIEIPIPEGVSSP